MSSFRIRLMRCGSAVLTLSARLAAISFVVCPSCPASRGSLHRTVVPEIVRSPRSCRATIVRHNTARRHPESPWHDGQELCLSWGAGAPRAPGPRRAERARQRGTPSEPPRGAARAAGAGPLTVTLSLSGGTDGPCPSGAARVEPGAPRRARAGPSLAARPPGTRARSHRHAEFRRSIRGAVKTYQADHNGGKAGTCVHSSLQNAVAEDGAGAHAPPAAANRRPCYDTLERGFAPFLEVCTTHSAFRPSPYQVGTSPRALRPHE